MSEPHIETQAMIADIASAMSGVDKLRWIKPNEGYLIAEIIAAAIARGEVRGVKLEP